MRDKNLGLLQFIVSFIASSAKRREIAAAAQEGHADRVGYLLGRAGSRRLVADRLRFCSACAQEQIGRWRQPYWTRLPQIVGIPYCPIHGLHHLDTKVKRRNPGDLHCLGDILKGAPKEVSSKAENRHLLAICEEAAVLTTLETHWDSGHLNRAWRQILRDADISSGHRGAVKHVRRGLEDQFGEKYLIEAGCGFGLGLEHSWLARFLRNPAKESDPLRHLLLLIWLGRRVKDLVEASQFHPFGDPRAEIAELKCQNVICPDRGKASIKHTRIYRHRTTRFEMLQLTCGTCGQTRQRPITSGDLPARDRVLDRGHLWDEKLREHWLNSKLSLRDVGRRLEVDSITVKRRAVVLGLVYPRISKRIARVVPKSSNADSGPRECDRTQRRESWLETLKTAKFIQKARGIQPATYAWLYRHDREWLRHNQPPREKVINVSHVDWDSREQTFLRRLPDALLRIIATRPFRQCNLTALSREVGFEQYLGYLDRMPNLAKATSELIEDAAMFAVRRIRAVAGERHETPLSYSRLCKLAGIRCSIAARPKVRAFIELELRAKN